MMKRILLAVLTALLPALALAPTANAATTRVPSFYEGLTITSTSITSSVPILFPDGTVGAPSIAFANNTDTGLYYVGADTVRTSINGTNTHVMAPAYFQILSTAAQLFLGSDTIFARRTTGTPVVNIGSATFSAATNSATVGGVFCVNTTSAATTGTTEEVLATCTLPANALSANGKGVRITAYLATAANANSKTTSLRFGGIGGTVITQNVTTGNNIGVRHNAEVFRTGSAAQRAVGQSQVSTVAPAVHITAPSADTTATISIVVTATTATAAGDITFHSLLVEFFN